MPKFTTKKEWLAEAKRLRASGKSAKEVASIVGEFSPAPGQRFSIHNSSKSGVVAVDMEARLRRGGKRTHMERSQSLGIGDTELPRNTTNKSKKLEMGVGPGMELHHRNSLIQNTPFYDGLSDKEAREFTSWARRQGWELGNTDGNTNIPLKISDHKSVHTFMRENDIEGARGPQKRLTEKFKGMSLDDRKQAFRNYMAYVQKGVDEHMASELGDVSVSPKHEAAQKKNLKIVEQQNEVERLKKGIGNIESGPRAGQRLPVNRRTLGDSIINDLRIPRSAKKVAGLLPIAGLVTGFGQAGHAASQGDYAEAAAHTAGALLGEVPIVGDVVVESVSGTSVADGTVTGQQRDRAVRPSYYGKNGPDLSTPEQSNRAALLRKDPSQERGYETIQRGLTQLRDRLTSFFK